MYEKQFNTIKEAWSYTPAVVTCKVITSLTEFPAWEDCPKDHLYIGVLEKGNYNREEEDLEEVENGGLYIVKYKLSGLFEFAEGFTFDQYTKDMLDDSVMSFAPRANQICVKCSEFTTRINLGELCNDCTEEAKAFD